MSGLRLAIGTFTILPAGRIDRVDRSSARTAMLLAPLVGIALGVVASIPLWAVQWLAIPAYGDLLGAALAIGMLAYCTRALHLDGLADTADALGSGKRGQEALAIARRGDVGPFGVITVAFVLAIDVIALAVLGAGQVGALALVIAVANGRLAATWACARGIPAARPDGLGAMVAGTVPRWAALAWTLLLAVAAGALTWAVSRTPGAAAAAVFAVMVGIAVALLLVRRCMRRLGGITGDVLGAAVETATAATLLALALATGATVGP